jgi:hypothetical protein
VTATTKAICGGCAALFFSVNACIRGAKSVLRPRYHTEVQRKNADDGVAQEESRWHKNEGYQVFKAVDPHALLYNGLPAAACIFCAIKSLEFTITQAKLAYNFSSSSKAEGSL